MNRNEEKLMKKEDILTILRYYKEQNAEKYGILDMGVFGSFARGDAGEESDLDVFVSIKTPNPFLLVHIKEDIEKEVQRHVDIVRFRETMNPYLKQRIDREGVHV
jgi:predicted nucleotidyltransferase